MRDLLAEKCVPIFIHGDDAESHRRRSFCVVSWGSCLSHGSPFDSRFVIYCGDNNRCFEGSYQALDAWVVWSLSELLAGEWSQTDPWGRPMQRSKRGLIAEGWRACLVVHKGDEAYLQKAYKTTNTWVSHDICFLCKALSRFDVQLAQCCCLSGLACITFAPGLQRLCFTTALHAPWPCCAASANEACLLCIVANMFACK